jgi:hypothetical protein
MCLTGSGLRSGDRARCGQPGWTKFLAMAFAASHRTRRRCLKSDSFRGDKLFSSVGISCHLLQGRNWREPELVSEANAIRCGRRTIHWSVFSPARCMSLHFSLTRSLFHPHAMRCWTNRSTCFGDSGSHGTRKISDFGTPIVDDLMLAEKDDLKDWKLGRSAQRRRRHITELEATNISSFENAIAHFEMMTHDYSLPKMSRLSRFPISLLLIINSCFLQKFKTECAFTITDENCEGSTYLIRYSTNPQIRPTWWSRPGDLRRFHSTAFERRRHQLNIKTHRSLPLFLRSDSPLFRIYSREI